MRERHLIGFSLSGCIKDIMRGKVDIEDVLFIQTGCNPVNEDQVDDIVAQYSKTYWREDPATALAVLRELRDDYEHPRIGWASGWQKNCVPVYWGNWLSINNKVNVG